MAITKDEARKGIAVSAKIEAVLTLEREIDQKLRNRYPGNKTVIIYLGPIDFSDYMKIVGDHGEDIIQAVIKIYEQAGWSVKHIYDPTKGRYLLFS